MISLSPFTSTQAINNSLHCCTQKRPEAKYLGSGKPGVNQMYQAKSSSVRNTFYVLNLILCATIDEHVASKRLMITKSGILQVLTIHIECLLIRTSFCHIDFATPYSAGPNRSAR